MKLCAERTAKAVANNCVVPENPTLHFLRATVVPPWTIAQPGCILNVDTERAMITRVARWGNSLALRIPRSVAAEFDVRDGDAVDVTVENGVITVRPATPRYTLDDLVSRITPRNRHRATNWGDAVGNEAW